MTKAGLRSGGQVLVDQLLIHGTDTAFCVPGESYLEVLDALYDARDRVRLINARQEAGAANMAEAYGKLTGRPGICLVTRGPGACQAAVGVHTAMHDSTPMILLVGAPRWTAAPCAQMIAFAETWTLPATVSFRRMDLFDNKSRVYAGDFGTSPVPSLAKRLKEADFVLVVGARLGDITTQAYTTLDVPEPKPTLVHVYPDPNDLGRVFRPDLSISP